MNDKRFEAWWTSNPARVALNPAAKEVARGIWRSAQEDFVSQLRSRQLQLPVAFGKLGVPDGEDDDTIPLARPRTGSVSYDLIAVDDVPDETPEDKGTPC